jgi:hypothetical protein
MTHLPLLHEALHRPERVLHRHQRIDAVQVVQVDDVDAQAPQALVARAGHVLRAAVDATIGVGAALADLAREEHALAPLREPRADRRLARAFGVDVGGVEEVESKLEAEVERGERAASPLGVLRRADVHAAEAQRRDLGARRAQAAARQPGR